MNLAHEILLRYGTELLALQGHCVDSCIRQSIKDELAKKAADYAELARGCVQEPPPAEYLAAVENERRRGNVL